MDKKRVLLVDDDISFANVLKVSLEDTGAYDVRVENWPQDAVAAAKAFDPDILLLDLIMPGYPGGNVVRDFEGDPQLKDIPIVFVTAAVRPPQLGEDGLICDHPCLCKPFTVDAVVEAIEKHARKAGA
jgi:CheY-like chemotaxis protein